MMVKYIKHLKLKKNLKLHNWLTSYGLRGFYLVVELHQEGSATNWATLPLAHRKNFGFDRRIKK